MRFIARGIIGIATLVVLLTSNNKALQRYDYEDPYETTKDVTVTASGEVVVDFDFTLRPAKGK